MSTPRKILSTRALPYLNGSMGPDPLLALVPANSWRRVHAPLPRAHVAPVLSRVDAAAVEQMLEARRESASA